MEARTKLGVILLVSGVIYGLIAVWVWALYGMSPNVSDANLITVFALICTGFITAMTSLY